MKKKYVLYFIGFALLTITFLFFNRADRQLINYTHQITIANEIYADFQKLSIQVNNAAVIHPDLLKANPLSAKITLFFADSSSVMVPLNSLKAIARDSLTTAVVYQLNKLINSEISWIIASNVPDSLLHQRSQEHIISLETINNLLKQGIQQTSYLITINKENLESAVFRVKVWMMLFIAAVLILLLYLSVDLYRQKFKTTVKEEELEASYSRLRSSQTIGQMGNWEYDQTAEMLTWSDEVYNIWGREKNDYTLKISALTETIHPDDRSFFEEEHSLFFSGKSGIDFEYRIVLPDGTNRWIHEKGIQVSRYKRPNHFEAIVQDITERKKMEISLREAVIQQFLYASIVTSSEDAIISKTLDGIITSWNPAAEKIFGYSVKEAVGKHIGIIIPPQLVNEEYEIITKIKNGEYVKHYETERLKKNGMLLNLSITISPVFDASGTIIGASKIARDITDKRRAEAEAKQLEAKYKALFENSMDGILLTTMDGKIVAANHAACSIFNMTESELCNARREDLVDMSHPNLVSMLEERQRAGGVTGELTFFRKGGESFPGEFTSTIFTDQYSHKSASLIIRDITDRKRAEENLVKSEKRFRALVENDDGIIAMLDEHMSPIYRTPSAERITGFSSEDRKKGVQLEQVHPDDRETIAVALSKIKTHHDQPVQVSYRLKHKSGDYIWLEGTFTNQLKNSHVKAIVANMRDVTLRMITAAKLKESELHYRSLIEQATDAIYIADASMKFIDINSSGCKMLGYSKQEFLALSFNDFAFQPEHDSLSRMRELKSGHTINYEQLLRRKDGVSVDVEINAKMIENGRFIMFARDISQRKNEEAQKSLLATISTLFNETASLNEVLKKVTELLIHEGTFSIAEAWLIGKDGKSINFVTRSLKTTSLEVFYDESLDVKKFAKGDGLPGVTWAAGDMQFWKNIDEDKKFIRHKAAKKAGLKTAYGIPIIFNEKVTGVFVLGLEKDEEVMNQSAILFQALGRHTGAEITRKQLEQELNQVFTYAPDVICIIGSDGYFKKVNPATCELFEYTQEELLEKPYTEFIHINDREKAFGEPTHSHREAPTFYIENRCVTKSGKIKWLAWTSTFLNEEGLVFSVAKDITHKKELEALLNKVNTLVKLGGWEVDLIKGSVYWTDITREIHEVEPGYTPDLQTGISFYKEEWRDFIAKKVRESIEYGKAWDEELPIITAKNNEKWIRTIGETEFVNGRCVRIYGSFQDIDQRKKAEIMLQKSIRSLEDYKFALDHSSIIAITDSRGFITHINDNFCKISKYSRDELLGKTHKIVNSGYHSSAFFNDLWRTIRSGNIWRGEIKNKAKDGQYYWVDTTIVPFLDKHNKPLQYLAIRFDITEKKSAIENVIKTLEEKNTVLESIGDAFFAVDNNWTVTYWNNVAEKALQKPKEEIIGLNLWEVFATSVNSISYVKHHEAMTTGQVMRYEDYYELLDKWYEINAYPSQEGLSVYFKDITERKLSELRLHQLNENLKVQARDLVFFNKELEQFAYVASHDLQEPLRMITTFLTKLDKKYSHIIDPGAKRYINFAVDGAKRMRQLILDLLEFSRVGRMEANKEALDLNELLDDIRILLRQKIEEKSAVINAAKLPIINSCRTPMRQVFQNLLSNALKYSREGVPVKINIEVIEFGDHWQFSVSDNGIGIEEEYFDKIFIIFQRLHNRNEYSGTGIGLAVAKKIVENQGGKIWLNSVEGKGSIFYFTLLK